MVGIADRMRRPAGPPLTQWPRAGQSRARKTAECCTPLRAVRAAFINVALPLWPGVRRAGLPRLSPALEPGQRRRRRRLDPFTLAALKAHVEQLARERRELGPDYQDHGVLFCWEDGRPPHPDTITRRFKKLAAAAGLPEIDLHDVRHSYATAGRDAKIDWKALGQRIGHSDVAFTMKQYVQADLEADRQVANTLAELIIGGSLASMEIGDESGCGLSRLPCTNPCTNHMQKALSLFEKGPLALVAGEGFEPSTSGL